VLTFPPRINLAQLPTPLQLLERASSHWGQGKRIWIKRDDLTGSTLTGNKVRKLEFIAGHAQRAGIDTLITCGGLQSNHARATANVCAQMGWHCQLVLRGRQPQQLGNTLLDRLFGAEVTAVEPREYTDHLDDILAATAEQQRSLGRTPLVIPTGGSNALGIWGYVAAAYELAADMQSNTIEHACVVTATGSGGTQAGLTLGMDLARTSCPVWGFAVCDDAAWFDNKVRADIEDAQNLWPELKSSELSINTHDGHIGPGYGRADNAVYERIAALAKLEGIVLDPVYTGKAFHGLCEEIAAGTFDGYEDLIFIHTGGIYGIFPHGEALWHAADVATNNSQEEEI
jgi:D-cysteine desulfhydrase